jgi:hypothetical protein
VLTALGKENRGVQFGSAQSSALAEPAATSANPR